MQREVTSQLERKTGASHVLCSDVLGSLNIAVLQISPANGGPLLCLGGKRWGLSEVMDGPNRVMMMTMMEVVLILVVLLVVKMAPT